MNEQRTVTPSTITLGGQPYPVAPLTLGDMRRVGPAFGRIGVDTAEGVDAQVTLITLAMRAADPAVTPDTVAAIRGVTFNEMRAAMQTVAALTGVELQEKAPGEDQPAQPAT